MKTSLVYTGLLCLGAACAVIVCRANAEEPPAESPVPTSANAETELVAALEQIVEIRQRQVPSELAVGMGQSSFSDVADAKVEVWRARVRLAKNRGESDAVFNGLRRIIGLREDVWRDKRKEVQAGIVSAADMEAAKLPILEARVDLCTAILEK